MGEAVAPNRASAWTTEPSPRGAGPREVSLIVAISHLAHRTSPRSSMRFRPELAPSFRKEMSMKIPKNRKPLRPRLPGLMSSPAAGPQVGTTRRSAEPRAGAGRLGRAIRDSRSTESETAPPQAKDAKARAVARWENEGGSPAKAADVAGRTKRSSATKPVRSAPDKRAKKTRNATDDSGPTVRSTKKSPLALAPIGQEGPERRKARSTANTSRIKRDGTENRLLGHFSASGKRSQARRDSEN